MSRLERIIKSRKRPPAGVIGHLAAAVGALLLSGILALGVQQGTSPIPPFATPTSFQENAGDVTMIRLPWRVKLLPGPGDTLIGVVEDPAVLQKVREDYLQAYNWLFESGPQSTLQVTRYFLDDREGTGILAASAIWESIEKLAQDGNYFQVILEGKRRVMVSNFSPDGLRVRVADVQEGPRILRYFDSVTGALVSEQAVEGGMLTSIMVYDPALDRWRIGSMEFTYLDSSFLEEIP